LTRAGAGGGGGFAVGFWRSVAALRFDRVEPRLVGREGLERAEIDRRGHERRIARRDEQLAEKVERLLGSAGDDDVVRFGRRAERAHASGDPFPQGQVALAD
jgi:hypothetical protein